jgi:hypothetical protein
MNRHNLHPDTELLDRLRAGLLDDDSVQRTELEAHLEDCQRCRQRYNWDGRLQVGGLAIADTGQRLDQARRRALQSTPPGLVHRFVPFAVAAAIALVAVLLVKPALEPEPEEARLASTDAREVPELYEELDFYLWLADHKEDKDSRT